MAIQIPNQRQSREGRVAIANHIIPNHQTGKYTKTNQRQSDRQSQCLQSTGTDERSKKKTHQATSNIHPECPFMFRERNCGTGDEEDAARVVGRGWDGHCGYRAIDAGFGRRLRLLG